MKIKKFYRIIVIFCVLVDLGVVNVNTVFAEDSSKDNTNQSSTSKYEEYKTFYQNDPRYDGVRIGDSNDSADNVPRRGCKLTALCMMMAYANPDLQDYDKWNPKIFAGHNECFTSGNAYFNCQHTIDPKWNSERMSIHSGERGFVYGDADSAKNVITDLQNDGYFVIVEATPPIASSTAHWSIVVGFDDKGDPNIVDTVRDTNGEVVHKSETWFPYIDCIEYYKYEGLKSLDAFKNAKVNVGNSKNGANADSLKSGNTPMPLTGMEDYIDILSDKRENIALVDSSYLSKSERNKLAETKTNMTATTRNVLGWFSVLSKFVGIILMVYSMLLLIAMIIDKINVWVDVKLTKILSFGIWGLYTDDCIDIGSGNKRLLSMKQLGIKIVIIFLIGMTLLTTIPLKIYVLLYKIW